MPQNEARAWWAEVADVRESIERRRSGDAAQTQSPPPADELAHVRARRAMAARERTGRFDREPRRTGRFDRDRDRDATRDPVAEPAPPAARVPAPAPAAPRRPQAVPGERRTVQITGHPGAHGGIARLIEIDRRRAARRPPPDRVGSRPDRLAMWAVLLGLFLILVAATSSHAAMLAV